MAQIGTGIIEIVGDARKLKASIDEAKRSLRTLGEGQKDISAGASQSIDKYIGRLHASNAVVGKSVREQELFKLALRGASNEQLASANSALKFAENQAKVASAVGALKTAFIAFGAIAVTGLIAAAVAFDTLIKQAAKFQDLSEKVGDSASALASLAVAAKIGGKSMEEVGDFSIKLSKNLVGVDDDADKAGAAIKALGLNLEAFKNLSPTERLEALAKALAKFREGPEKGDALEALAKGGAALIPVLKEVEGGVGRLNILTDEQIALADEYADKQAKTAAQISAYAQVIAIELLPTYNELSKAFLAIIKEMIGVEAGADQLKNSKSIQQFADNAVASLAFVINSIDGVVRAIEILSIQHTAMVARGAALLKGPFGLKEAWDVTAKSFADTKAAMNRPLLGTRLTNEIANMRAAATANANQTPPRDKGPDGRPKLPFAGPRKAAGGGGAGPDLAAQARSEAAAQLAFDLEQIKKRSDAQIGAFANAERIMEAMRGAALVNDRDYYASKLGFITLNSQAQEKALQEQIARLQKEEFTGKTAAKDRLDRDRKVVELEAEINKVRSATVANVTINAIQQEAANKKIEQSYKDATEAAQQYLDTIAKQNAREIAGIGRGSRFREEQAGISSIDDKRIAERQRIERDRRNNPQIASKVFDDYLKVAEDTYSKEIALYQARTIAIKAAEDDWVNGASEALNNYIDEAKNVAKQTEELFTKAFQGLEDALVDFVTTGKMNFKSLIDSITADITRMAIKQSITGPLAKMMNDQMSSMGGGGNIFSMLANALTGGGGGVGGVGSIGSHASGINFVPKTGLALIHKGERIIPASENTGGGSGARPVMVTNHFVIQGSVDTRSQMQLAAAAGQGVRRALASQT